MRYIFIDDGYPESADYDTNYVSVEDNYDATKRQRPRVVSRSITVNKSDIPPKADFQRIRIGGWPRIRNRIGSLFSRSGTAIR